MKSRRWVLGGVGMAGLGTAATAAYRAAPSFWQQYWSERQRDIDPAPHRPDPKKWPDAGVHAAWLGHTTVLVKIDGFTFVTDPIFSDKAGIHWGPVSLGVKRLVQPALSIEDLPQVDAILISHAHMDHFDVPSLRRLEDKKRSVVTAWETADLLRVGRYREVHEMRWGQRVRLGPLTVRALEVNHWGARLRSDTYRGYNGYVIESDRHRVLFAGDTALTDSFAQVKESRPVDLAIMPIGAYNPWVRVHCTPEDAWRMANMANVDRIVPVHHQTFRLSREPYLEPIERMLRVGKDRVALREIGEEIHAG